MSLDDGPADGSPEILPALEDRQPGFHLLATGCVGQTRADTGSVVLGVPGEASLLFDCSATTREAWEEAYRREMQDRIARILPEGSIIALTGYWQYEVTMITTTCTEFVGSVEVVYSEDQSTAVYTPDGQYVGVFSFVGGVPQRFDFYSSYPCTEMVVSEGTWVEFDPGEGGGGGSGGGGGGGGTPPPSPPPPPADSVEICKVEDHKEAPFECLKVLKPFEFQFLQSLREYMRPPSEILDPVARQECVQALAYLNEVLDADPWQIFKGAYDTPTPPSSGHVATTTTDDNGTRVIHVDPFYVNTAHGPQQRAEILRHLLHEAVHAKSTPQLRHLEWEGTDGSYSGFPPFDKIHSRDADKSCVTLAPGID